MDIEKSISQIPVNRPIILQAAARFGTYNIVSNLELPTVDMEGLHFRLDPWIVRDDDLPRSYYRFTRVGGYDGSHVPHSEECDLSMIVYNYCHLSYLMGNGFGWPNFIDAIDLEQYQLSDELSLVRTPHCNAILFLSSNLEHTFGVRYHNGNLNKFTVPFIPSVPTPEEVKAGVNYICQLGFRDVVIKHMLAYYLSYGRDDIGNVSWSKLFCGYDTNFWRYLSWNNLCCYHLPSEKRSSSHGCPPSHQSIIWVLYCCYEIASGIRYGVDWSCTDYAVVPGKVDFECANKIGKIVTNPHNSKLFTFDHTSNYFTALFDHMGSQWFGSSFFGDIFSLADIDTNAVPQFDRFLLNGPHLSLFFLETLNLSTDRDSYWPVTSKGIEGLYLRPKDMGVWLCFARFSNLARSLVKYAGLWARYFDPSEKGFVVQEEINVTWAIRHSFTKPNLELAFSHGVDINAILHTVTNEDQVTICKLASDLSLIRLESKSLEEEYMAQHDYLLGNHRLNAVPGQPILNRKSKLMEFNSANVYTKEELIGIRQAIYSKFPVLPKQNFSAVEIDEWKRAVDDYELFTTMIAKYTFKGPDDDNLSAMRLDLHRKVNIFCHTPRPIGKSGWYFGDIAFKLLLNFLWYCPETKVSYQKFHNFYTYSMHNEIHATFAMKLVRLGIFHLSPAAFGEVTTQIDRFSAMTGKCPITGMQVLGTGFNYSSGILTNWNILTNPNEPQEVQNRQKFEAAVNNASSILGLMNNPTLDGKKFGVSEIEDKHKGRIIDPRVVAENYSVPIEEVESLRFENFGKHYDAYTKCPEAIGLFNEKLGQVFDQALPNILRYMQTQGDMSSDRTYAHKWHESSTVGSVQHNQSLPEAFRIKREKVRATLQ